MRYRYVAHPQPHLVIDELVPPNVYATMAFPDDLVLRGANWGLTSSDPEYATVLRNDAWRDLHDLLRGPTFVGEVLQCFAEDMRRANCLVDADRARLTSYVESREEKEARVLATLGDPNELFTRLDFQSKSEGGYREFVHLDWARRLVGAIFFFSDADEEGLEGGELAFYRDRDFRNDRWCHDPELTGMFRPRHNTGIIFLNSNTGFHGPRAITALRGRRRWLYYTISSHLDIWPCAARSVTDVAAGDPEHAPAVT
jgi:hypothetical protein